MKLYLATEDEALGVDLALWHPDYNSAVIVDKDRWLIKIAENKIHWKFELKPQRQDRLLPFIYTFSKGHKFLWRHLVLSLLNDVRTRAHVLPMLK